MKDNEGRRRQTIPFVYTIGDEWYVRRIYEFTNNIARPSRLFNDIFLVTQLDEHVRPGPDILLLMMLPASRLNASRDLKSGR